MRHNVATARPLPTSAQALQLCYLGAMSQKWASQTRYTFRWLYSNSQLTWLLTMHFQAATGGIVNINGSTKRRYTLKEA